MNKKQKHGTAKNTKNNTPNRMQEAQKVTQMDTQEQKPNKRLKMKKIPQYYAQRNQDETRLRTLKNYGQEYRGKIQQTEADAEQKETGAETSNKQT